MRIEFLHDSQHHVQQHDAGRKLRLRRVDGGDNQQDPEHRDAYAGVVSFGYGFVKNMGAMMQFETSASTPSGETTEAGANP